MHPRLALRVQQELLKQKRTPPNQYGKCAPCHPCYLRFIKRNARLNADIIAAFGELSTQIPRRHDGDLVAHVQENDRRLCLHAQLQADSARVAPHLIVVSHSPDVSEQVGVGA